MLTLEQAKNLRYGQTLHHVTQKNRDGSAQRWRVNGRVKTWKRNPNRVQVPLKNGLRNFDYLTENDLHLVELA